MDVKRKLTYIFRLCLPLLLLLNACDDMEDKPFTSSDITGDPTETDTADSMRCAKDCSIRITVR